MVKSRGERLVDSLNLVWLHPIHSGRHALNFGGVTQLAGRTQLLGAPSGGHCADVSNMVNFNDRTVKGSISFLIWLRYNDPLHAA